MPMDKQDLKVKQLIDVSNGMAAWDIEIPPLYKSRPLLAIALTYDGQILPVFQNYEGYPVLYTREKYIRDIWRGWLHEEFIPYLDAQHKEHNDEIPVEEIDNDENDLPF